jgi:hypothetical protein
MNTISIQCVHCQKRYNAPATMAGKKVKCKHCGKVFAIPADAAAQGEGEAGLSAVGADAQDTGSPIAPAHGSRAGGGGAFPAVRDASGKLGAAKSRMDRNENATVIEYADERPSYSLRPSISYAFPGADVIENIAPPLMILLGLGWLGVVAVYTNNTNASWVGGVRAVAYLVLSLGLAFPLGYWAIRRASRVDRFMLPPKPAMRALACTSLAFTFAFALWLAGASVGMLVAGTFLGLIVALAAVWFLFRLQPQELGNALGGVGAAFIGSVVIAYLVLLGVHTVFAIAMAKSGTNTLDKSPMGPTFAWDVARVDEQPKRPKKNLAFVPPTQPATDESESFKIGGATQPTTAQTTPPAVATTGADPGAAKTGDPGTAKPVDANAVAMAPGGEKPAVGTTPKPPETADTTPGGNGATPVNVPSVVAAESPLVAKATPIAALPSGSQLFFPPNGANVVGALRRPTATDEQVEFYTGHPLAKADVHADPFVTEKKVVQNYVLSPNGETMARLTSFPLMGVQLIGTATGKEIKTIPLDGQGAQPYLVGYGGGNDSVVLLWQRGGQQSAIEVVNTKATGSVTRVTNFLIDTCDVSASNPVISQDGQKIAVATVVGGEGGIDVYNLMDRDPKRRPRTLKVALPKWTPPAGMAWGPQGMLAAYFEIEGNGVLYHFQTSSPSGAPAHAHVFRGVRALMPQGGQAFVGRTLEFVSPNEWLVFGRQLIDVETGKSLGELGVENPKEQRVVDKDNLLILSTASNGTERLVHVELKGSEVVAKRNEARGVKGPK